MKKILLPIITLLLIGLTLVSCDLLGDSLNKKLLFIDVTSNKSVFEEGDIIKDFITVKSFYSDGSEKTLSKESYSTNLTDDKVTSETKSVTVTYGSKTKTIPISVSGSLGTLMSIEVLSLPKRLNYKENSNFDDSGLEVVGLYSDNTVKIINDYTLSFEDGTNVGTVDDGNDKKTIKNIVSYGGKETSFDINVRKLYKIGKSWFDHLLSTEIGNFTKIIFDYTDNLPSKIIKKFSTPTSIGDTNDDLIYLIEDGTEIYIFSDGLICEKDYQWTVSFDENKNNSLKEISFNNYDTSNFSTMINMFMNCKELTSITFGDNFDTSNVTDMFGMFSNCSQLTSLDLSSFDTSKVEEMSNMFMNCSNLTSLNLSSFDTSKVTKMSNMFSECEELTDLDISSFNTSNVKIMINMFSNCSQLTSLDLSSFDTSKVENMNGMFGGCSLLEGIYLNDWDTSNVKMMIYMFGGCSNLTSLDLSSFDTSEVEEMSKMFMDCDELTSVKINPSIQKNKDNFGSVLSGFTLVDDTYTKNH